jgi:hypothetical protein
MGKNSPNPVTLLPTQVIGKLTPAFFCRNHFSSERLSN